MPEGGSVLEAIPWAVIGDGGLAALALVAVLMVLTGRLVPKTQYDQVIEAKDHWRTAFEQEQEANRLHARASDVRGAVDETVVKLVTALQEQSTTQRSDGGET